MEGLLSVLSWLEHAKQQSLSGCTAMVSEVCNCSLCADHMRVMIHLCLHGINGIMSNAWQVLACCSHKVAGLRAALVARSSVFTRQDVLLEAFASLDSNSDSDVKKQLRSAELKLLQVLHVCMLHSMCPYLKSKPNPKHRAVHI